ncbi:MAG TPA: lipopolysaccharide biosynthesis protein [Croceibacterium sp.]|nr:lipopolysaccharide biosynthesis protein [Croceibacterium sp.]
MTAGAGTMAAPGGMLQKVRQAVIWRSGSQIVAQAIAWGSTFLVIRLLDPSDYGLFAMTQVVLVLLNVMNGYGMASALIRAETVTPRQLSQVLGLLLLLNGALAAAQFATAPWVAAYYRQPMVADLLRVQSLLYLATPFLALPHAVLSRRMDFKRPAQIRLIAALAGAATALGCAYAGLGVWTLVAAPMALFAVEAIGMTWAAGGPIRPSFQFAGTWSLARFGGTMTLVQFFWFMQSQADVFIAGRMLDPHRLGLYTTAVFLTQLIASKFVPPLNEVAFAAYSRMQGETAATGAAFVKTVRLVLLVTLPAYAGLAVVADPFVATVLGGKWSGVADILPVLTLAMAMLTLQILFAPATNALNRPSIALRVSIAGGIVLPTAFLVGIAWDVEGLAWAWVGGMAVLLLITATLSLPAIQVAPRTLAEAALPIAIVAGGMALLVTAIDGMLPIMPAALRLTILAAVGLAAYPALLAIIAPGRLWEAWELALYRETDALEGQLAA